MRIKKLKYFKLESRLFCIKKKLMSSFILYQKKLGSKIFCLQYKCPIFRIEKSSEIFRDLKSSDLNLFKLDLPLTHDCLIGLPINICVLWSAMYFEAQNLRSYFRFQILRSYYFDNKNLRTYLKLFKFKFGLYYIYAWCYFRNDNLRSKSLHTATVIRNEIYNKNRNDIYINLNISHIVFIRQSIQNKLK